MQTQWNHKRSQQNTSAIHIWNNSNVSKVNYQHIARRPPVCAVYISKIIMIMHNGVNAGELNVCCLDYISPISSLLYWCFCHLFNKAFIYVCKYVQSRQLNRPTYAPASPIKAEMFSGNGRLTIFSRDVKSSRPL